MKVLIFFACVAVVVYAQSDCKPRARCLPPKEPGNCTESTEKFYYDKKAKECKPFTYTGCGGNVNRFASMKFCQKACLCGSSTTTTPSPNTTTEKSKTTKATTTKKPTKSTTKKPTKKTTKSTTKGKTSGTTKSTKSTTKKNN